MFSLLSPESGWAALCASINCASRSAQAIPAGPPPTITTSAGIWGRSTPSTGLRKINIPPLVVFAWQGPPFAIRHDADREANHLGDAVAIVGGNKMVEISEEL